MPNIEAKNDGNPTYQNGDLMKQVHMDNKKSFVGYEMFCQLYIYLRAHPYGVDRTISTMTNDE